MSDGHEPVAAPHPSRIIRGLHAEATHAGRKNIYTCALCQHSIVTIDRADGYTPTVMRCKTLIAVTLAGEPATFCRGVMVSAGYPIDVQGEPTYEWYRPTPRQIHKMRRDLGNNGDLLEHVRGWGLLLRRIAKTEST